MFFIVFTVIINCEFYPIDPLYDQQFSINNKGIYGSSSGNDINIKDVWKDGIVGDGITVGVTGNGCYLQHLDLVGKNIQNLNFNFDDPGIDVSPYSQANDRGRTTGLLGIAVSASNSVGIVGVAPNANFYCIKQTYHKNTTKIAQSIKHQNEKTDVKLLSIPHTCDNMYNSKFATCEGPLESQEIEEAFTNVAKPPIFVAPVGDDAISGIDTNFFADVRDPHVISVADTTPAGARSFWSTRGTCIVCNAPAGGHFAPPGEAGNAPHPPTIGVSSPTDSFSSIDAKTGFDPIGSGAAIVSGVVALMKEVNKELTYRDVQAIIALTADKNDPKHGSWTKNGAGFEYSEVYGFGRINAKKAVEYAKNWTLLPPILSSQITFDDAKLYTTRGGIDSITGKESQTEVKFIECAVLEFTAQSVAQLRIDLISPMGTRARVIAPSTAEDSNGTIKYVVRNFFGESSTNGKWRLDISRDGYGIQDKISNIKITVYGMNEKPSLPAKEMSILEDPYKPLPESSNLELSLITTSSEVKCGTSYKAKITTHGILDRDDITYDVFVRDEAFSTFFQLSVDEKRNTEFAFRIPCALITNKSLYLHIENRFYGVSAERPIVLLNDEHKMNVLSSPTPYQVFTKNHQTNQYTINVDFANNMSHFSSDATAQGIFIGIWDLDRKENVYRAPMLLRDLTAIHFTLNYEVPHGVLYVIPQWQIEYDGCTTLIQPISLLENVTKTKIFNVPLAKKCSVPPGIVSTEEKYIDGPESLVDNGTKMWIYVGLLIAIIAFVSVGTIVYFICRKKSIDGGSDLLSNDAIV